MCKIILVMTQCSQFETFHEIIYFTLLHVWKKFIFILYIILQLLNFNVSTNNKLLL